MLTINIFVTIKLAPKAVCQHGHIRAQAATRIRLSLANYKTEINLPKPTGHVMHQQFNIQQLYVLPTLYLCVLFLSENKQRLVTLTA